MATSIHIHFWTTLGERIYGLSEGAYCFRDRNDPSWINKESAVAIGIFHKGSRSV